MQINAVVGRWTAAPPSSEWAVLYGSAVWSDVTYNIHCQWEFA
jgi:hypothetical protein